MQNDPEDVQELLRKMRDGEEAARKLAELRGRTQLRATQQGPPPPIIRQSPQPLQNGISLSHSQGPSVGDARPPYPTMNQQGTNLGPDLGLLAGHIATQSIRKAVANAAAQNNRPVLPQNTRGEVPSGHYRAAAFCAGPTQQPYVPVALSRQYPFAAGPQRPTPQGQPPPPPPHPEPRLQPLQPQPSQARLPQPPQRQAWGGAQTPAHHTLRPPQSFTLWQFEDMKRRVNAWSKNLPGDAWFDFYDAFGWGNGWKVQMQNGIVYVTDAATTAIPITELYKMLAGTIVPDPVPGAMAQMNAASVPQGVARQTPPQLPAFQQQNRHDKVSSAPPAQAPVPVSSMARISQPFQARQPSAPQHTTIQIATQAPPPQAPTTLPRSPAQANKKRLAKDLLYALGKRARPDNPRMSVPTSNETTVVARFRSLPNGVAQPPPPPPPPPPPQLAAVPLVSTTDHPPAIPVANTQPAYTTPLPSMPQPAVPQQIATSVPSTSQPETMTHVASARIKIAQANSNSQMSRAKLDAMPKVASSAAASAPPPESTDLLQVAGPTRMSTGGILMHKPSKSPSEASTSLVAPSSLQQTVNSSPEPSSLRPPPTSPSDEEPLFLASTSAQISRASSPLPQVIDLTGSPPPARRRRNEKQCFVLVPPPPPHIARLIRLEREREGRGDVKGKGKERETTIPAPLPKAPVEENEYDYSYDSQGIRIEDEMERNLMTVACTRLQEIPCKWEACDVVANSSITLFNHLRRCHRPEALSPGQSYSCRWTQCGKHVRYGDRHLMKHAFDCLLCPYKTSESEDCKEVFRTVGPLIRHAGAHTRKDDQLKPSCQPCVATISEPPPAPPPTAYPFELEVDVAPAYISRDRSVQFIAEIKHATTELEKDYDLDSRRSPIRPQPRYEFLTDYSKRYGCIQSEPAWAPRPEPLNTKEVKEALMEGVVLLDDAEDDEEDRLEREGSSTPDLLSLSRESSMPIISPTPAHRPVRTLTGVASPQNSPQKQVGRTMREPASPRDAADSDEDEGAAVELMLTEAP